MSETPHLLVHEHDNDAGVVVAVGRHTRCRPQSDGTSGLGTDGVPKAAKC